MRPLGADRPFGAEVERVANELFARNGNAEPWKNQIVGTPEQVVDRMRPYLGIGFRTFIVGFPSPYDQESLERLAREVRPMLEGRVPAETTA